MNCTFKATRRGCRCLRCGRKVKGHNGVGLIAECHVQCERLGGPTGEIVAVVCVGCGGQKTTREFAVHQCTLFGECLPGYRCTKDALSESMSREMAVCAGCEHFVAPPSPAG